MVDVIFIFFIFFGGGILWLIKREKNLKFCVTMYNANQKFVVSTFVFFFFLGN